MRFCLLFFIVLLGFIYLTASQGTYEDCCLRYVKKVRPNMRHRVINYKKQEMDGGCNISAVVFTLRHGRMFCADPREKWVRDLMFRVDKSVYPESMRRKFARG